MPKYISTTKKIIRDPAKRCRPPIDGEVTKGVVQQRREYELSHKNLPRIWSWTMQQDVFTFTSLPHVIVPKSKSDLLEARDRIPYFPFCKDLYKFATGASVCNWLHVVGEDNESSDYTYNFPCGCTNPQIGFMATERLVSIGIKSTSAYMCDPASSLHCEVPRCPVFAQGAAVKKRKRRKSKVSLTDNRWYRRLVRSRSQKAATVEGCSKQLMNDDPTDSE
jgi:hypothetical protein